MNIKELEEKIREINSNPNVENVIKIIKEQEINLAQITSFVHPSLLRTE